MKQELSQQPVPDRAEPNAFFPSAFSLNQFTRSTSDLSGADYAQRYDGGKKILVIATDERYLAMANGTLFSTGNHPVETLLPMYHLHQAGFAFDIATPSGLMVKFEHWAMPCEDAAIQGLYQHYLPQFRRPRRLREVLSALTAGEQDYAGVFIPGGHGALIGLPFDADVAETIRWTMREDRYLIAIVMVRRRFSLWRWGRTRCGAMPCAPFPTAPIDKRRRSAICRASCRGFSGSGYRRWE